MMTAEINVFVDKGQGHVKVFVPAAPETFDANGEVTSWAAPDVAQITALYNALTAALSEGHELGKDPPRQYGGGGGARGARPEMAAPADLDGKVPQCDGEPMSYDVTKGGKGIFKCRKGAACSKPRMWEGKPQARSVFEEDWRASLEMQG